MVKNSRKKTCFGAIRFLNQPILVQVEEDEHHIPRVIMLNETKHGVSSVTDIWEIVDEWWRSNPISRRYYRVDVESGATLTVYRDLVSGYWYFQQV